MLTYYQIKYLKSYFIDCNYKVKELAVEYNASQFVLNK